MQHVRIERNNGGNAKGSVVQSEILGLLRRRPHRMPRTTHLSVPIGIRITAVHAPVRSHTVVRCVAAIEQLRHERPRYV